MFEAVVDRSTLAPHSIGSIRLSKASVVSLAEAAEKNPRAKDFVRGDGMECGAAVARVAVLPVRLAAWKL